MFLALALTIASFFSSIGVNHVSPGFLPPPKVIVKGG
jgi:hypothetical protein